MICEGSLRAKCFNGLAARTVCIISPCRFFLYVFGWILLDYLCFDFIVNNMRLLLFVCE